MDATRIMDLNDLLDAIEDARASPAGGS